MAVHFHTLQIKDIIKETSDAVSISFDLPPEIAEKFAYKEGQNLTLRTTINGEDIRRSYSICKAPHENCLQVAVKQVPGGVFSTYAYASLKPGDPLEVLPPTGKFTVKNTSGNFLAIAAGSGITPVISIIKHILFTDDRSSVTLLYGNKNRGSIIFFEAIEALKNIYMERFQCIHILSRERTDVDLQYGRIDTEKLKQLEPVINFESMTEVILCGPEEMIFTSRDFLLEKGLQEENIHFELFTTPGMVKKQANIEEQVEATGPQSKISLKLDGRTMEFDLARKSLSILDAALQQGADLPYACKGGVCSTCRARVIEGKVEMDVNYALEKDELEQGFVLTCQSHPVTEKVTIDFDTR